MVLRKPRLGQASTSTPRKHGLTNIQIEALSTPHDRMREQAVDRQISRRHCSGSNYRESSRCVERCERLIFVSLAESLMAREEFEQRALKRQAAT
mmetsp:Transcript_6993/g.21470  ORF Transcript_6993/g.21470 Transcript_6993/m.21470 type:complete len:95 (-) Transcript_6993:764-1048(-)|eukprot:scaffold175049_cov27-Tisochrysis_lutea.AAC.2